MVFPVCLYTMALPAKSVKVICPAALMSRSAGVGVRTVRNSRVMRSSASLPCQSFCAISRPRKYVRKPPLMTVAPRPNRTAATSSVTTISISVNPRLRRSMFLGRMSVVGEKRMQLRQLGAGSVRDPDPDKAVAGGGGVARPRHDGVGTGYVYIQSGVRRAGRRSRRVESYAAEAESPESHAAAQDQLHPLLGAVRGLGELRRRRRTRQCLPEHAEERVSGDTHDDDENDELDQRESAQSAAECRNAHGTRTSPVCGATVTVRTYAFLVSVIVAVAPSAAADTAASVYGIPRPSNPTREFANPVGGRVMVTPELRLVAAVEPVEGWGTAVPSARVNV